MATFENLSASLQSNLIKNYSEMADDFFFSILCLKSQDQSNEALPFLHAHVLELCIKAACYKLGISFKANHGIFNLAQELIPNLGSSPPWLPTEHNFKEYKKVYLSEVVTQNLTLPSPEEVSKLELAYYMENVMNLKYGYDKNLKQISTVGISYKNLNEPFVNLFMASRNIYKTTELSERLKDKIRRTFGKNIDPWMNLI